MCRCASPAPGDPGSENTPRQRAAHTGWCCARAAPECWRHTSLPRLSLHLLQMPDCWCTPFLLTCPASPCACGTLLCRRRVQMLAAYHTSIATTRNVLTTPPPNKPFPPSALTAPAAQYMVANGAGISPCLLPCLLSCLQSHAGQTYGGLPVHMYAVHSTAASALTAHVAANAAAQQQHARGAGPSAHGQQSSSSRQDSHRPAHTKEDFVEVEKSNMVMLVSRVAWAAAACT